MRILIGIGEVDHDVRPFLTLDPMHRRQHDAVRVAPGGQVRAQPFLERGSFGVLPGELAQRCEVVALCRTIHAPPAVIEGGHRAAQPDLVDQYIEQPRRRCATGRHRLHAGDVIGELGDAGGVLLAGEPIGQSSERCDVALLAHPIGDLGVQGARGPAHRLTEIIGREAATERQSQPRQRCSDRRSIGELGADPSGDRYSGDGERHLNRSDRCVDPGQHRHFIRHRPGIDRRPDRRECAGDRILDGHRCPATRCGRRRSNHLVDAAPIVTHQTIGGVDDAGGTTVVDLEWMVGGAREPGGEVDQPAGISAVVAVDRLVVVSDAEHCAAWRSQKPYEQQVGRRQVLELVDQQHAAGTLRNMPSLGLRQHHVDRPPDLTIEVDQPIAVERCQISGVDIGQPVDVTVVSGFDFARFEQPQPNQAQRVDPGGQRVGVAAPRNGHELLQDPTHVGLVDRAPRALLGSERATSVDDRQGDRVESSNLETGQVARSFGHLLLSPLVECHEAHSAGGKAPHRQQLACPLGQHARLARTCRSDDSRRSARVRHGRQLVVGEIGRGLVGERRQEAAVFDLDGMHDRHAVDRVAMSDRSAVDPYATSVGRDDVARSVVTSDLGPVTGCLVDHAPPRSADLADVDRVRPDEVVEFVENEREAWTQLMMRCVLDRLGRLLELGRQLDHDTSRSLSRRAQRRHHLVGIGQGMGRDHDPIDIEPLGRSRLSGRHHDVSSELDRPPPRRRRDPHRSGCGSGNRLGAPSPYGLTLLRLRGRRRVPALIGWLVRRGAVRRPGRPGRRVDRQRLLGAVVVGPALADLRRALVGPTAIHARDHPDDPSEGVFGVCQAHSEHRWPSRA